MCLQFVLICGTTCSMSSSNQLIREIVLTAFFTAAMAVASYISIYVGPVPVTLQSLLVLVTALLGGTKIGLSAILLYLGMGALGLPFFAGGIGGFAHFAAPSGGFLLGLLPTVLIASLFSPMNKRTPKTPVARAVSLTIGALLATILLYCCGLPFLKWRLGLSWAQTLAVGLYPFIVGDILKMIVAILMALRFYPKVQQFLFPHQESNREYSGS